MLPVLAGRTLAAPMPPRTVPLIVAPFTTAPDEGGKAVTGFVADGAAGGFESLPHAAAIPVDKITASHKERIRIIGSM
jgi:hypothetical protein